MVLEEKFNLPPVLSVANTRNSTSPKHGHMQPGPDLLYGTMPGALRLDGKISFLVFISIWQENAARGIYQKCQGSRASKSHPACLVLR